MLDVKAGTRRDAAVHFAEYASTATHASIGADSLEITKRSVLDTFGVSLAASTLAVGCRELAELAAEGPMAGGSTVIGFGHRVPAWTAAWVNGALSHSLDFDDIAYDAFAHPSGAVVPAALAIAERVRHVSGREFLTAVALGQEIVLRMSLALKWEAVTAMAFLPFPLIGTFAAAVCAGHLLRLSPEQMESAIGIALAHASGAGVLKTGMLRGLYSSWAAYGGTMAAVLAQKGITGPPDALEGRDGFFDSYWHGEYDRSVLLEQLGQTNFIPTIGFKAWPSCSVTHTPIDATLTIMRRDCIDAANIEAVTVRVGPNGWTNCTPLENRRRPETPMDAKFSVPYAVALACTKGRVSIGDFTPQALEDQGVLAFAQRVTPVMDRDLTGLRGVEPSVIEIRLRDGTTRSHRTEFAFGHHKNPMPFADVATKFRECAAFAVNPLAPERIDRIIAAVDALESVDDMSTVAQLLY